MRRHNIRSTVYFTVMFVTVVAIFGLGFWSTEKNAVRREARIAAEEEVWQEVRERYRGVLGRDYKGCVSRERADLRGSR